MEHVFCSIGEKALSGLKADGRSSVFLARDRD